MRCRADLRPILLSRPEIDDVRWNIAVKQSLQQVVYAYSWYLDVVCEDWVAIVWPTEKDYAVILPLPVRRKYGIAVVQQPLFCQYLGFFSKDQIPAELLGEFLKVINLSFSYISSYNFNPHNCNHHLMSIAKTDGWTLDTLFTHRLSLIQPFETIYAGYKKDRKVNLRRSRRAKWLVSRSRDIDPLLNLFKQNHTGQIMGGVDPKAYDVLKNIFEQCRTHAHAELWYVGLNEEKNAGVLIVRSGDCSIYIFNAADQQGRKGNARSLLLNLYFQRNAESQILFDFESPAINDIVSFYKSFNATEVPFFSVFKNALPFPFRQIQNWRKRILRLFSVFSSKSLKPGNFFT